MSRDVVHKYWFEERHAQVLFDKDMGMYLVEMYEKTDDGMKKHATVPMITGQVIHNERYAEDAAENWVHGCLLNYYQRMTMKNNEVTTLDGIICCVFAYGYFIGFMTLNIPLIVLTEISWVYWVYKRKGDSQ